MIDYSKVTLSVLDYNKNKIGMLYSPDVSGGGQAYDITLTHDSNGWKELAFSIDKTVNGSENPRVTYLINEYLIEVDDGGEKDIFIISESSLVHNNAMQTINATCNHNSARLRMKKLYLLLDDTNGIGTCSQIATIILQGTGWSLGTVDVFYEPDGTTEKVRTLASSGKEGAYQLVVKLCELFNARPVFHGDTQTIDILSFAPYHFVEGQEYPTLLEPDSLVELNYSKAMSGVTRKLNTENLITRLYVEGSFGDSGYVGIETANPLGTNFLLNFDYFRALGLLTIDKEDAVADYIATLSTYRDAVAAQRTLMSSYETQLMNLWGTADYSVYDVVTKVSSNTLDVAHVTSLGDETSIETGNIAAILLSDNTHLLTSISTVTVDRIVLMDVIPEGVTISAVLIYRLSASGEIGGKEVAAEAAEESKRKLVERVGDNLVSESDVVTTTSTYLVKRYFLTEPWQIGVTYTLTIWGNANTGNNLKAWRDNGTTALPDLTYDPVARSWSGTFVCPASAQPEQNVISVYNYPSATATLGSVQKIKVEFGTIATPWTPASQTPSTTLIAEYEDKINRLYYGTSDSRGIYELTRTAVATARTLQTARDAYQTAVNGINSTENTFAAAMGDLLRDGYWQDTSYVVGQEQNLYNDAIDTHKVMSRPVADYQLTLHNMRGVDASPHIHVSINSAAHIIDESIALNTWGYVDKVEYCLDKPYETSIQISTSESRFSGQSFTQILSQVAEVARDVRDKRDVFARASLISKAGTIPTAALDGIINTEITRLLSNTSNWQTDSRGNLVFTSQDGQSAMMLTGEGFMIADGKTISGDWNWKSFGSGKGFTADQINAGTLQAGIVKILGTDQFYWDADNIYIFDPSDPKRQIRMGRYDGQNYGIGFTQDDGATWVSAFGFDGVNLNYATMSADQISGLSETYLTQTSAQEIYETKGVVGALSTAYQEMSNNILQNIQFTAGGIIIQQVGSPYSSRFTATALEFWQGGNRVAWFENSSLYANNIVAASKMNIGKLTWYVNADGSVSVKWNT